jgi:hypothetical protein
MYVAIVFPVNHGIGDELSFSGPLISAYLAKGATINVWTFHPYLYEHSSVITHDWRDEELEKFKPQFCDVGIYFAIPGRSGLPIKFDRTSLVFNSCLQAGWLICEPNGNNYIYTAEVMESLDLEEVKPPWTFFPKIMEKKHILINLIGKGSFDKGLPLSCVWETIRKIVDQLATQNFIVIHLENEGQPIPPSWVSSKSNLKVASFDFGNKKVTEIYYSSKLIITAEGGGYHLGFGLARPTLMVTSSEWYSRVIDRVLPLVKHDTVLFEAPNHSKVNAEDISNRIVKWINENYFFK